MKETKKKLLKDCMKHEVFNELLVRDLWGDVLNHINYDHVIVDNSNLLEVVKTIKESRCAEDLTMEQIVSKCQEIQNNIWNEIPNNCAIDLSEHFYDDAEINRDLDEIVIKLQVMGAKYPEFICLGKEMVMDTTVFIGGTDRRAYFLSKDTEGKIAGGELMSFSLFSLTKSEDNNSEAGFFVDYNILTTKVQNAIFVGWSLNVIRDFMLGDWFKQLANFEEGNDESGKNYLS